MVGFPDVVLPFAAAAAAGAVGGWALLERLYVAVPPNRALVLFGRRAGSAPPDGGSVSTATREPRILIGGGAYLAPWNRATAYLSLAPIETDATVRALHALEGTTADGWEVELRVEAKIPAEPRALRAAAENLLGLGEEELRAFVRRAVEGAVPAVLARLRPGDEEPDWERLASELHAAVAPELVTSGLVIRSLSIRQLTRIAPSARGDRSVEPRHRPSWAAPGNAPAASREPGEPRLVRVERGLRVLAADLARLLRDEPGAPPEPAGDRDHDSVDDGGSSAPARLAWRAAAEADGSPEPIG